MVAVLALVVGCGEEPQGPSSEEFAAQREALRARVAEQKANKRKAPQQQASAPVGTPEAPLPPTVTSDYVYDSTEKRDPFRNFKWDRPDRFETSADAGPLEQFDVGQLSLVAVVWKTGKARALVQDPSGESYIVAEGARMGKNEGRVISIEDNLVLVKETYVDFLGQRTTKDIEMRMRRNEGG